MQELKWKKNEIQLKQNKLYGSKDRQKKRKNISGQVKAGKFQRTKKFKYLGITINEQRNIKERIEKLKQKCETISQEGVDKSAIKTF